MQRPISLFFVTVLLAVMIGCSGFDKTVMLVHPESAGPSSTFDVALVNLYTYLGSGSTVPETVERDSLHLLVGMPGTWEVVEVKMVVVDNLSSEQLFDMQGNLQNTEAISSLLEQYRDQAVVVSSDALLVEALGGQTVTAHNQMNTEDIPVEIDAVTRWDGFSAPVNIVLEQGSKTDTALDVDSVVALVASTGLVPDSVMEDVEAQLSNPLVPDTIGITMVPVAIYLTMKTGEEESDDTLFYFTKTGMMNPTPNTMIAQLAPEMAGIEIGDMTFAPISVAKGAAVIRDGTTFKASGISISTDYRNGTVRIRPGMYSVPVIVDVYSLAGHLVTTITATPSPGSAIVWNGTDGAGKQAGAGSYFVRVTGSAGSASGMVQLAR